MSYMFTQGSFNQAVNWDTSSLIDASFMFRGNAGFNQPLDAWNVWRVTNMGNMFDGSRESNGY